MDFPLAEPVADVLHAGIDRGDLGYTPYAPRHLRHAFAALARRRLRWNVDPEQVTLVADVMAGLVELFRVLTGADEAVGFVTPAYPPFFTALRPDVAVAICHFSLRRSWSFARSGKVRSIERITLN